MASFQAEVGTSLRVIARPPLAKDAEMSKVLGVDDEEAPCVGDFGFCLDRLSHRLHMVAVKGKE